jgi:hypothetical protein
VFPYWFGCRKRQQSTNNRNLSHNKFAKFFCCLIIYKEWNEIRKNSMEEAVSGWQATIMVLNDSVVELLSLICGICLIMCLNNPINHRDFATASFRTSCICIPVIVFQYHGSKKVIGCLDDEMMQHVMDKTEEKVKRGFPVILVFHTITTLALFFMQFQAKKMNENVRIMLKLKEELTEARKSK